MHTLIVRYTPRTGSHSAKLLDEARSHLRGSVEELDLARELPPLHTPESVDAYAKRNYAGQALSSAETAALAQMDRLTAQVKRADVVIIAAPFHNFGMPAALKAWFDAVMQKGQTWDYNAQGRVGLMKDKKALVLFSSGGIYPDEPGAWDTFTPLARIELTFMGYSEFEILSAQGANQPEFEQRLAETRQRIASLLARWYANAQEKTAA